MEQELSDRELIELAAKAVGYKTRHKWNAERLTYNPPIVDLIIFDECGELVHTAWNPLENDAQAFRLAVKLNMCITNFEDGTQMVGFRRGDTGTVIDAGPSSDKYAATRRLIVEAAAEMSRFVI